MGRKNGYIGELRASVVTIGALRAKMVWKMTHWRRNGYPRTMSDFSDHSCAKRPKMCPAPIIWPFLRGAPHLLDMRPYGVIFGKIPANEKRVKMKNWSCLPSLKVSLILTSPLHLDDWSRNRRNVSRWIRRSS